MAQAKIKEQYDKASSVRELKPGDNVLVLMPILNNKLFATWTGPAKVIKACGNDNYEIQMTGKRKVKMHINSL